MLNITYSRCIYTLWTKCFSTLDEETVEEPRILGLAMVPGHHIVSIAVDKDVASNVEVL